MSDNPSTQTPKDASDNSVLASLVKRFHERLLQVEDRTLDVIESELEEAIELEATAEEMARDELNLLGAYLRRDMHSLRDYVASTGKGLKEWLRFDTDLLESRLAELLLMVADSTTVQQAELKKKAETDACFDAGESVLGGTFSCVNCGDVYVYHQPTLLSPCLECGGEVFHRISVD